MATHPSPATGRAFRVESRRLDDVMVVECHGKLTFENAPILRDEVRRLIPSEKCIVLDLKEVPLMDSSGLGSIATLYVSGRTRGCRLQVMNASPALRKLFSMTNLLSLFEDAGRCGAKFP
jgi:anti-anti-sigma factor